MIKTLICLSLAFILVACAATYKPPVTTERNHTKNLQASKTDIFNATKQVLTMAGYQIQSSDEASGTIATSFRQMRLNATQCDCGTTMGLPYIKDKRTITNVAISAVIEDNQTSIIVNINGEYLKGDVTQSITFDCVSTGTIEETLFEKIARKL